MWETEHRSEAPELMDDPAAGGRELTEALRQLRVINRLLGAAWPTLEGVSRLWREADRPARLTVLDAGSGSGDQCRLLLRWARVRGVDLRVILTDLNPETCREAARQFQSEPRVGVRCQDLLTLQPGSADIVTASMVLHHFPTHDLPRALMALRRGARLGVVINDLHRHWLAWRFIGLATRVLSGNRMIRHDAPLSVLRGFTAADLERLKQIPGLHEIRWQWRPLFRYLLLLPGAAGGDGGRGGAHA